jgi:hypothetical protein
MKLQRREKILVGCVCGLVVAAMVYLLFVAGDSRPVEQLLTLRKDRKDEVLRKQRTLAEVARSQKQFTEWQRRAVPPDQTAYMGWLRNLANKYITKQFKLDSTGTAKHGDAYTKFSFKLSGHASLAKLTEFLYDFYKAGHLHQIDHMELKPVPGAREPELEVTLMIEALSLPGVNRKELSKEEGHSLQKGKKLADYSQPITTRDLFVVYEPSDRTSLDVAQYTFVTALTEVDGKKQVWIHNRMAGRLWKLGEGESFEIGDAHGTVRTINPVNDEVVVDFDGHRRRLHDGDNLRGGVVVRARD